MRPANIRSRALALAILAALGFLVYSALALPIWQSYTKTRDAAAEHEAQIGRLLGIVAESKRLAQQRDDPDMEKELRRYLIEGASATLAAAALQNRIGAVVKLADGQLVSTKVLPPETGHGYLRVAVQVRLALDTPALQKVLYELEDRPPLLKIDDVVVVARGGRSVGRMAGEAADLDVQLRISGWTPDPGEGA